MTTASAIALKGVGKINGDGWKDVTVKGETVFVWNTEMPDPYSPGQYPRIGFTSWTASTDQYDFSPATLQETQDFINQEMMSMRIALSNAKADALVPMTEAQMANLVAEHVFLMENHPESRFPQNLDTTAAFELGLKTANLFYFKNRMAGAELAKKEKPNV